MTGNRILTEILVRFDNKVKTLKFFVCRIDLRRPFRAKVKELVCECCNQTLWHELTKFTVEFIMRVIRATINPDVSTLTRFVRQRLSRIFVVL